MTLPPMLTRIRTWLADYAANPDPFAEAGNIVALVLAGNGPFYPAYIVLLAGSAGMPWLLLTMCAFPFFLAVPALSRRSPLLGRIVLALTATINTVFCTWVLGLQSGTELFLLPCATLAGLLFRPSERLLMLVLAGLPVAAWLLLHDRYGAPPYLYPPEAYSALFSMNAVSAGMISIFLGIVFAGRVGNPPDGSTR
jgi:hypothetical protein